MMVSALRKLAEGRDLTQDEARAAMACIMDGDATHAQIGAFLGALRVKRETVDELTGFARAMREKSVRVSPRRRPLIDTCGTGGDASNTFNISTTAVFVIAAAGVAVAKHGNRAMSSKCGSADVLAALGVKLDITPEQAGHCIDTVGVGFLFAPHHHPAMRHANQPRKELGIRTVFNVLGPLTNPAGATRQTMGVFDPDLCPKIAETLNRLGCERAMVFHGMEGLDEISTCGPTRVSQLQHGRVSTETWVPAELSVAGAHMDDLRGADTAEESADIVRSILGGERGPRADIVCVNAAAGLIVGGMAEGWRDGMALARRMLETGKAKAVLDKLVATTNGFASAP